MPHAVTKHAIRKDALTRRDSISMVRREEKNNAIMLKLLHLPEFANAETIFAYASFRSEVDTMDFIRISLGMGKHIVVPKVDKENHRLRLYEIKNLEELVRGYMWILEPLVTEDRLRSLEDIELVIIPGAAFDICGNRLGYGAGFYDISLSEFKRKAPVIAPAYEEQIVESIPAEPHDVRVDKIVTERRVIECVP